MGRRGRLPKSAALRALEGNRGRRPAAPQGIAHLLSGYVPPPEPGDVPEPPEPLRGEARAEWDRVAPELHRRGWLRPVETSILSAYCVSWADWQAAAEALGRALADPSAKPRDVRLWQGIVRSAETRTLRCAREFGMTPASRSRLPEAAPEPREPHPAELYFT